MTTRFEREAESRARHTLALIELARERDAAQERLDAATAEAIDAGLPIRHVARLIGLSHVTVGKRWR